MLEGNNIYFSYQTEPIIQQVSFQLDKGEVLAVLGESGCGKSTLLEIIYGLLHIEKGKILYHGKKLLGPNFNLIPGESFMKYLPQHFDLMPYTSVFQNVGSFLSNMYPEIKLNRVNELLEVVDMLPYANTKVKFLSGGQQQRVALAKVLAKEPEVLLLDEPFSHIDQFRKNELRVNLFDYLKKKQISCVIATHDAKDALSFADKILLMKAGRTIVQGHPKALYENPISPYVASFFNRYAVLPVDLIFETDNNNEMLIVYPEEVFIVEESQCSGMVKAVYFEGGRYLVDLDFKGYLIKMFHNTKLIVGIKVNFDFDLTKLKNRNKIKEI